MDRWTVEYEDGMGWGWGEREECRIRDGVPDEPWMPGA